MVDAEAENVDLGHPNDSLSEDQKDALRQVAERVRRGGPDGPSLNHPDGRDPFLVCDHYLLRFLRARAWDVDKTCLMLKNHYAWRVEKNIALAHHLQSGQYDFDAFLLQGTCSKNAAASPAFRLLLCHVIYIVLTQKKVLVMIYNKMKWIFDIV